MQPDSAVPFFQRQVIAPENAFLHFNELLPAFMTNPLLRDTRIVTSRDDMVEELREQFSTSADVLADIDRYHAAASSTNDVVVNRYFDEQIHSHEAINNFYSRNGYIPQLTESLGCSLDMEYLLSWVLADRRVVVVHPRLRALDRGMKGAESFWRDSDFVEWFDFIVTAGERYPEVMFVVVGRLQEKPLELLRLPNVMTLRALGYGLGHELTLLKWCDLFIGTSSGFAAMANFCDVPYFVTRVSKQACETYGIGFGDPHLPFATEEQILVYENETTGMLMSLLEEGLARASRTTPHTHQTRNSVGTRVGAFVGAGPKGSKPLLTFSSTHRFFTDDASADSELRELLAPRLLLSDEENRGAEPNVVGPEAQRLARLYPRYRESSRALRRLARGAGLTLMGRQDIRLRYYILVRERRPLHLRHRTVVRMEGLHLMQPLRWAKRTARQVSRLVWRS
jgi:hypothetical protein